MFDSVVAVVQRNNQSHINERPVVIIVLVRHLHVNVRDRCPINTKIFKIGKQPKLHFQEHL